MARHRHPTCAVGNADGGEDDRQKEDSFPHLTEFYFFRFSELCEMWKVSYSRRPCLRGGGNIKIFAGP